MKALLLVLLLAVSQDARDEAATRVEHTLEDGSIEVFHEAGPGLRQGEYERRLADGTLVEAGAYRDGERLGTWRTYHRSGARASRGRYRDGRRTGEWTFWHDGDDAPVRAEGEYEDGLRTGWWTVRTVHGEVDPRESGYYRGRRWRDAHGRAFEAEYRWAEHGASERRHGELRAFRADGERWIEGRYRDGLRHGEWRFWHPGGRLDPELLSGTWYEGRKLAPLRALAEGDLPGAAEVAALRPEAWSPRDDVPDPSARRALALWREEPDEETVAMVTRLGRDAVPTLLGALAEADLETSDALWAGPLVRELLLPLFRGHGYAWTTRKEADELGLDPAARRAHNRLAVLRWHALWEVALGNELFFELELPVAEAWDGAVPGQSFALDPPLPASPHLHSDPRDVRGPAEVWVGRFSTTKRRQGETREVREAVDRALGWLAGHARDGSLAPDAVDARCTALDHSPCGASGEPHVGTGLTALALLAFLADGHLPGRGDHGELLLAVTRRLLEAQDPVTGIVGEPRTIEHLYQHAVATRALCELVPFVDTPAVRRAAASALDHLLAGQNPGGGWRYAVPPDGTSDTSMTTWAVLALVAARDAGIGFDEQRLRWACSWFDRVTDADSARTGYQRPGGLSARVPGRNEEFPADLAEPLTAGALLCRLLAGERPDEHPLLLRSAELVARRPPTYATEAPRTDMTSWYLGTHALFHLAPERSSPWRAWEPLLEQTIVASQRTEGPRAGSWDPVGAWGYYGGRTYATALSVLTLLVHSSRVPVLD